MDTNAPARIPAREAKIIEARDLALSILEKLASDPEKLVRVAARQKQKGEALRDLASQMIEAGSHYAATTTLALSVEPMRLYGLLGLSPQRLRSLDTEAWAIMELEEEDENLDQAHRDWFTDRHEGLVWFGWSCQRTRYADIRWIDGERVQPYISQEEDDMYAGRIYILSLSRQQKSRSVSAPTLFYSEHDARAWCDLEVARMKKEVETNGKPNAA
jgi:hypothetical protein